jgi:hypothetical protein
MTTTGRSLLLLTASRRPIHSIIRMRLAAGGAPVAVKRRAVNWSTNLRTSKYKRFFGSRKGGKVLTSFATTILLTYLLTYIRS